jgi:sporulation protein YlmC with PRC-barrel domain
MTAMSDEPEFVIGSEVSCTDGVCGELRRIVVDPVARKLTHLVVAPRLRPEHGRLVPVDLVESADPESVRLHCDRARFEALDEAEEKEFLPGADGSWQYTQEDMLSWPYYGLADADRDEGVDNPQVVTQDRVPEGEAQVRRGDRVQATDGEVGRVHGLVVEPKDHRVTHLLLEEGHLWGEREIAIPVSAVAGVDDGVSLTLTKDQVRDLPQVAVDRGR